MLVLLPLGQLIVGTRLPNQRAYLVTIFFVIFVAWTCLAGLEQLTYSFVLRLLLVLLMVNSQLRSLEFYLSLMLCLLPELLHPRARSLQCLFFGLGI